MDKYIVVCEGYGIIGQADTPEKALKDAEDTIGKEDLMENFGSEEAHLLEVAAKLEVTYKAEVVKKPVVVKEPKNATRC